MLWLLLVTQPADAADLSVRGDDVQRTLTCEAGQAVLVQGSSNRITLEGSCGKITVQGSNNKVTVDGLSRIVLEGSSNTLTYHRNLAEADTPPIRKVGVRNSVRRAQSQH